MADTAARLPVMSGDDHATPGGKPARRDSRHAAFGRLAARASMVSARSAGIAGRALMRITAKE